jgi:hypothetical protein
MTILFEADMAPDVDVVAPLSAIAAAAAAPVPPEMDCASCCLAEDEDAMMPLRAEEAALLRPSSFAVLGSLSRLSLLEEKRLRPRPRFS